MTRKINMFVIHCAATTPSMDIGKKEIDRWHRARGFFGIGYHFVIRRDGSLEEGRPLEKAGAHASGYNENSVGICLVGGIDEKGNPENNFTNAQWITLKRVITMLDQLYPNSKIVGHNELTNKACPCFNVQAWLKNEMRKIS